MLLPQALPGKIPDNNGLSALDEPLEKINLPEGMVEKLQVQAGYSAVDLMGHVNNARYVEWICDCFPASQFASHKLDWLQINYVNEVKPSERVSIATGQSISPAGVWAIQGSNMDTSSRAFEAIIKWDE